MFFCIKTPILLVVGAEFVFLQIVGAVASGKNVWPLTHCGYIMKHPFKHGQMLNILDCNLLKFAFWLLNTKMQNLYAFTNARTGRWPTVNVNTSIRNLLGKKITSRPTANRNATSLNIHDSKPCQNQSSKHFIVVLWKNKAFENWIKLEEILAFVM